MVNINSLERDGLRQAELCPRNTMSNHLTVSQMLKQSKCTETNKVNDLFTQALEYEFH